MCTRFRNILFQHHRAQRTLKSNHSRFQRQNKKISCLNLIWIPPRCHLDFGSIIFDGVLTGGNIQILRCNGLRIIIVMHKMKKGSVTIASCYNHHDKIVVLQIKEGTDDTIFIANADIHNRHVWNEDFSKFGNNTTLIIKLSFNKGGSVNINFTCNHLYRITALWMLIFNFLLFYYTDFFLISNIS